MKKILITTLIFFGFITSGYKKPDVYVIDAAKNSHLHNNLGLQYLDERCYYAAIQEFKIAISLNPDSQASAMYYTNIGNTWMKLEYYDLAQDAYDTALKLYSLNLQYYKNLVKCFKAKNLVAYKIKEYSSGSNPLNRVMLGLLYVESGDIKRGIITLDEFTMSEPDLLITTAVKQEVKNLVKQINQN